MVDELFLFHPMKHPLGNWEPEELRFEEVSFEARALLSCLTHIFYWITIIV